MPDAEHWVLLAPVRDGWGTATDLRYVDLSQGAAAFIGLPAGLVVGRTVREIFGSELAGVLPRFLTVCDTGIAWRREAYRSADGIHHLSLAAEMRDGLLRVTYDAEPRPERPSGLPEVEAIARVATAIGEERPTDELFALVAERLEALYGAERVSVARREGDGVTAILSTLEWGTRVDPESDLPVAASIRTAAPVWVEDLGALRDPLAGRLVDFGFRAALAVPLVVGGAVWGGLGFACLEPPPASAEATLAAMGALLGRRLAQGVSLGTGAALPDLDGLTGLPDHRALRERLVAAWIACRRDGRPLSLAVLDTDRLGEVNARHGHEGGDAVLRDIAERLRTAEPDPSLVGRLAGEGFAWLMPGHDAASALLRARALRMAVKGACPLPGEVVTLSGGIAEMAQASRPAELLRLAEGALSWSKTHGRDLVLTYDPAVVEALSATEWAVRVHSERTLASIEALARVVDAKDHTTFDHSERVGLTAAAIARRLGWTEDRATLLHAVGRVHDVGKIAVPDEILGKPGPLTEEERARVRDHAERGAQIVSGVLTDEQVSWVRHHHERWDGAGYPWGFAGEEIPEGARIIALADAFDVIRSDRPYSTARSLDEALAECRRCSGSQFWPDAVAALLAIHEEDARAP